MQEYFYEVQLFLGSYFDLVNEIQWCSLLYFELKLHDHFEQRMNKHHRTNTKSIGVQHSS